MARDAYYVVNRYAAKMMGSHLGSVFVNQRIQMITNFATYYGEWSGLQDAVKDILNTNGIKITQYPYYITYAREIYRHWKRYGGRTLYTMRDAIRDKWISWGLDANILSLIDQNVFGLPPQTPPAQP